MKVIDLLNMISKGEKLPNKIKYNDITWKLSKMNNTYDDGTRCLFEDYIDKNYVITDVLNDEVVILEEDKKIKRIGKLNQVEDKQNLNNYILRDKINEIIDYINKEDK